jgi:hypothetical protein
MMPRHRKDCRPRHGGLRREGSSRRSVPARLRAHVRPPARSRGRPRGPAFGRDAGRASPGRALAPPARRPRLHLARSLLATPWFAAGAGIVIAAVLAVDSPTALTYGPTFPTERCPVHGCGGATGQQPGQPATATPGIALRSPGLKMKGGASRPGGVLLGYQIVRQWSSGFLALITIPGVARTDRWNLWFGYAAAHVDRVWGARWRPSGNGDGGTADGPSDQPGHPRWDRGLGAGQVLVSATGTPQAPSGCALDGISCRFGRPAADSG